MCHETVWSVKFIYIIYICVYISCDRQNVPSSNSSAMTPFQSVKVLPSSSTSLRWVPAPPGRGDGLRKDMLNIRALLTRSWPTQPSASASKSRVLKYGALTDSSCFYIFSLSLFRPVSAWFIVVLTAGLSVNSLLSRQWYPCSLLRVFVQHWLSQLANIAQLGTLFNHETEDKRGHPGRADGTRWNVIQPAGLHVQVLQDVCISKLAIQFPTPLSTSLIFLKPLVNCTRPIVAAVVAVVVAAVVVSVEHSRFPCSRLLQFISFSFVFNCLSFSCCALLMSLTEQGKKAVGALVFIHT